ncbi:MAG: hypothetical protein ACW981_07450 [Candidatus Hodarchaeales archaeon]
MSQSFEDVKIGLRVFRDNISAYFAVMAFIIGSLFIITTVGLGFTVLATLMRFFGISLPDDTRVILLIVIALLTFFFLIVAIFFSAFNGTLYGLSYDIMSSGDLYTEFKHAFTYFRRFWSKYLVISLLTLAVTASYYLILLPGDQTLLFIIIIVVDYFSILYITGLYTSVTANGSLIRALKESGNLLKKDFKRIAITLGMYFIIFRAPYILFFLFLKIAITMDTNLPIIILGIIVMMIMSLTSFIGAPILTIFATRIYNTNKML